MRGDGEKKKKKTRKRKEKEKKRREGCPTALTGSRAGDWPEGRAVGAVIGGKDVHRIFQWPMGVEPFTLGRISITRFGQP